MLLTNNKVLFLTSSIKENRLNKIKHDNCTINAGKRNCIGNLPVIYGFFSLSESEPEPYDDKYYIICKECGTVIVNVIKHRFVELRDVRRDINNYFEVFGLDSNASMKEISKAFKKLVKKYHPDVTKNKQDEEILKQINDSYDVVKKYRILQDKQNKKQTSQNEKQIQKYRKRQVQEYGKKQIQKCQQCISVNATHMVSQLVCFMRTSYHNVKHTIDETIIENN